MAGQRDESGEGNLIRYQERSDTKGGVFFAKLKQQDSCSNWTNWANDKDQGQWACLSFCFSVLKRLAVKNFVS